MLLAQHFDIFNNSFFPFQPAWSKPLNLSTFHKFTYNIFQAFFLFCNPNRMDCYAKEWFSSPEAFVYVNAIFKGHRCNIINRLGMYKKIDCHELVTFVSLSFKALADMFSYCQRPVFPLGISQHHNMMHKMTNLWKFGLNWSSNLQENRKKKHHCCISLCAFKCIHIRLCLKQSLSESYSKTMLLQREPFLTVFYNINSSALLVTK